MKMTDVMEKLNWKLRKMRRYNGTYYNKYAALASRIVGGKYFIYWHEGYCSEQTSEWVEVRAYEVEYQTRGGGTITNVSRTSIHTLPQAKALAELHHAKLRALINKYGTDRNIPEEAWRQFHDEMLTWQEDQLPKQQGEVKMAKASGVSVDEIVQLLNNDIENGAVLFLGSPDKSEIVAKLSDDTKRRLNNELIEYSLEGEDNPLHLPDWLR
jgi:hypothetical protein